MTADHFDAVLTAPRATEGEVPDLLTEAAACAHGLSDNANTEADRLLRLRDRLMDARLQVAILGQFKRGKSTLLNALVGADILPTAMVPLTAVPTFLVSGVDPTVRVSFVDGRIETHATATAEDMQSALRRWVTEEGNPDNRLEVARAEVTLPALTQQHGLTLIDTPGIGSTLAHNTEAARAALPECDAAIFVVSPDPPITAAELAYFREAEAAVADVAIVLNKVDAFSQDEVAEAAVFIRRTLAERMHWDADPPLFPVSARQALRAKLANAAGDLEASGLPVLEQYLGGFVGERKHATLRAAVLQKARDALQALCFEAEIVRKALLLPIETLDARRQAFEQAVPQFEQECRAATDLLTGDRKRCLTDLDIEAEKLQARLVTEILGALTARGRDGRDLDEVWREIKDDLPARLDGEYAALLHAVRGRLQQALEVHRRRADALIGSARQMAAEIMEVPYRAPEGHLTLDTRAAPYWSLRRQETLNPIPPGALDGFLPQSWRRKRAFRRIRAEIERLTRRNVENLRWTARQNIEEAFRRFTSDLGAALDASLAATRDALGRVRSERARQDADIAARTAEEVRRLERLRDIEQTLEALSDAGSSREAGSSDRAMRREGSR